MFFPTKKLKLPSREEALPGRAEGMPIPARHYVLGTSLEGEFPGMETALFAMGCFWGAEKKFWEREGVL
ncbi:MAG TPA: peptide-methionine (S)-S-oxide reductase, partial [Myxococcaceae bacterium]|nr:peptide-methionine (S)-S-oxide reductase [Myxococcaceae bacterium]